MIRPNGPAQSTLTLDSGGSVTAQRVALAATDGNPATTPVAGWEVLQFPTPPVPDYPSGHATAGGAAAAIIEALAPGIGPSITTTSGSLPGW